NRLYFLCAFLSNFLISLFNDLKIKRIIGNLSLILNKKITVIRDSVKKEIFFNELVFSDVILLKVGDVIPCDSKVIFGNVFVNESFLTGETDDIEKKEGSKLLAKSFIVNGTCYAEIIGISNTSYIAKVQEKLRSFLRPKSQIIKFLNKIIFFNTFLAFAISLIKLIFFVRRNGWNLNVEFVDSTTSSFLTMLSVGMYLMISIIITVDIVDLYINHKVLINEPYSLEMIARSNVFCFDKTGTLTTGKMEVKELIPIKKNDLNFLEKIISQIIYLNKDENLTAKALKKYFPFKESILLESNQYSNIPFNSKNKYSAISYNGNTYVLGAADFIEIENIEVKKIVKNYEKEGFRVLVVAKNNKKIFNHKVVGTFIVIGILVLCEEIRTNIVENLNNLKANNIDSYIISGDSEIFLSAIAKKINFDNNVICLKNLDINKISDAIKNKYKIFARATPEQKKIIVDELKKQNKVVSMVGDGLNDLLALKSANCSIAISNENNSITKSVSNIILFNSDFSDLKKIIEISKRNINKIKNACILFLTKAISLLILNFIFFMFNINFKYRVNNFFVWEIVSVAIAPFFISLEKN
ncbi:HAD-IC family P-type ATPase, partial [bacterium]|nr:HAD-IC family P-type ATPase [bacterium]